MNKLPGAIVRIAAAITLLHDPDAQEITGATLRDAVRVGRAYISHARAAFGLTRPDGEAFESGRQVLATVRRMCLDAGTDMRLPTRRAPEAPRPRLGRDRRQPRRPDRAAPRWCARSACLQPRWWQGVGDECAESWRRGQTDQRLPARIHLVPTRL